MLEITTKEQFDQETKEGVVLVDVYAPWCGPCKMIAPALLELEKEMPEVKFVKVNADEVKDVTNQLDVMSIPTLIVLKDGVSLGKKVGFVPKGAIEEFIQTSLETAETSV